MITIEKLEQQLASLKTQEVDVQHDLNRMTERSKSLGEILLKIRGASEVVAGMLEAERSEQRQASNPNNALAPQADTGPAGPGS